MKEVRVGYGQSIYDIAIQHYGSIDAIWNIIDDNKLSDGLDVDLFGGEVLLIQDTIAPNSITQFFTKFSDVVNNSDLDQISGVIDTLKVVLKQIINESFGGDGAILIDVFGGVTSYTYEWRNQYTDQIVSTNQNLISISGGIYRVKVTDSNNSFVELTDLYISIADNNNYLTDEFGNIITDESGNPLVVN